MSRIAASGALFLTLFSLRALAADLPPPPPQDTWTGKAQFGFVSSHGNTDAKSANAALDMSMLHASWKHAFTLGGLYGSSNGITSAERWRVGWQSNYDFTPALFVFGALRDEHDMFSGFVYQATASTGLGYKVIDSDTTKLTAQLGVGYRRLQPEELLKDASGAVIQRIRGEASGDAVATAGLDFSHQLTATTSITNKLLVESGSDNTLLHDDLALQVKISDRLALSAGYGIQNNSSPPPGLKKLDTVATLNLVASF
ncbi:MAG TPA: DUF481 domain-containing protein [Steroidobacteraceae bacterium]|jgi:putative salt-induced outer membrane protein